MLPVELIEAVDEDVESPAKRLKSNSGRLNVKRTTHMRTPIRTINQGSIYLGQRAHPSGGDPLPVVVKEINNFSKSASAHQMACNEVSSQQKYSAAVSSGV